MESSRSVAVSDTRLPEASTQDVAENRNRCFSLDDSLREAELLEQVIFLHAEFHREISSANRQVQDCYYEGLLYPVLMYV